MFELFREKSVLVPIEDELEKIMRLVSKKEKQMNPQVKKHLLKLRKRLIAIRDAVSVGSKKFSGAY